uniref:Olfactory receptor n=1 Tax=Oryzias latipes TaxID=8090 RepID=A0A3P9IMX6_ORYLA
MEIPTFFMDNTFNITDITLSGYVEMNKYRYLCFFIMFAVYVLIICGNSAIVYIICSHKDLHKPMYVFIAALLLNCFTYSTTVYPKLLIDFLSEEQIISYSACLLQFFMFYSAGGSEFLLLAAMAYDRYVSICKPLRYAAIMTKRIVTALLILAWTIPPLHFSVLTILNAEAKICKFDINGIFCNNTMYKIYCLSSRSVTVLGIVALVDLVILPMLFTVFTYANIFLISYKSCKEFRKKAAETCFPHLLVLFSFSCLVLYDVIIARVDSHIPKIAGLLMTLQAILYHPLLNPFIYGLKMKEISKHLKRYLFRPCFDFFISYL